MSSFAFSSKSQVDNLVTYSVKIYTRLYLAGLMDQHLQNPLCAHSMYVNLYIQHTYKKPPWFRDQEFILSSPSWLLRKNINNLIERRIWAVRAQSWMRITDLQAAGIIMSYDSAAKHLVYGGQASLQGQYKQAAKNYCREANWTGSPAEMKAYLGKDQGLWSEACQCSRSSQKCWGKAHHIGSTISFCSMFCTIAFLWDFWKCCVSPVSIEIPA